MWVIIRSANYNAYNLVSLYRIITKQQQQQHMSNGYN